MTRRRSTRPGMSALQAVLLLGAGFLVVFGLTGVWKSVEKPTGTKFGDIVNARTSAAGGGVSNGGPTTGVQDVPEPDTDDKTEGSNRPARLNPDGTADIPTTGSKGVPASEPQVEGPRDTPAAQAETPAAEKEGIGSTVANIVGAIADGTENAIKVIAVDKAVTELLKKGGLELVSDPGGFLSKLGATTKEAWAGAAENTKWLGRLGLAADAVGFGIDLYGAVKNGDKKGVAEAGGKAIGSIIGGDLGAAGGAAIGFALGGPPGAVIGGIAGALGGGKLLGDAGAAVGGKVYDYVASWWD